ncbi:DUF4190 domain-containing protein [Kitasatospora sp. NPDC057541]|uniref:DUF4190 domain-containing protein n=1 Tax=unclassified Kitasatospora TaxID=2633591 RepID=UPI0036AC51D8
MSKPESDAPAPEPVERVELSKPAAEPEAVTEPVAEPVAEAAPAEPAAPPAPASEPAPETTPEAVSPEPADAAPVVPAAPAPDPWATPAPGSAQAAAAAPPAADPWAAPSELLAPVDPDRPRATGWAAVAPAAHSGFQPGFPYLPAPTVTNGFAVAALVTGLFCMWPLAVAFAIVALVQIPKRNEKGRGMAVAGLITGILGVVVTLFAFIGLLAAGLDEGERYADSPRGPKGSVAVEDLVTGDCFNRPPFSSGQDADAKGVYWVVVVPCSAPHHGEVAGFTNVAGAPGRYPGRDEVSKEASRLCIPVHDDYALDPWIVPDGVVETYYFPSQAAWVSDDRRVTCTFEDETRVHTGSVRTDRSKLTKAQRTYLDAAQAYNGALAGMPEGDVDEEPEKYRTWAKTMATACRKEVTDLSAGGTDWPGGAKAKLIELGAVQLDAANAWDAAAKSTDEQTLDHEVQKAQAQTAKSHRLVVEIRGELGLSTGEQASDIRV